MDTTHAHHNGIYRAASANILRVRRALCATRIRAQRRILPAQHHHSLFRCYARGAAEIYGGAQSQTSIIYIYEHYARYARYARAYPPSHCARAVMRGSTASMNIIIIETSSDIIEYILFTTFLRYMLYISISIEEYHQWYQNSRECANRRASISGHMRVIITLFNIIVDGLREKENIIARY